MKKLGILLFLSMLFISCKDKEVHSSKLQQRNGLVYEINQKKEFTGTAITTSRYGNTTKTPYKKGKKDGLMEDYWKNGQLKSSTPYKNGKIEGTCLEYFDNGQLVRQKVYKDDVLIDHISMNFQTGKIEKREIFEEFKFIQFEEEMRFKKITLKYNNKEEVIQLSVGDGNIPYPKFPEYIKGLSPEESNVYTVAVIGTIQNHLNAKGNYLGYEYNNGQWIAYLNYLNQYPVKEYQNGQNIIKMYRYYKESMPVENSIINIKSREKIIDSLKKITTENFWDNWES